MGATRVMLLADLPDPGARIVDIDGEPVIVVRLGDGVRGYRNLCPHMGTPLSPWPDRVLTREGDRLICFGHGALFRPEDGLCVAGPCEGKRLQAVALTVREGWVLGR